MLDDIDTFLTEAQAYCDRAGIKLATLGAYAVQDKTLFDRLSRGRNVGIRTIARVRQFMAANPRGESEKDVA